MLMSAVVVLFSGGIFLFLSTSNPSLLISWLVMLSFLVGLILSFSSSSWMFFVVVLLFTGGVMVLFSYMLTLVSSAKISLLAPGTSFFLVLGVWLMILREWEPLTDMALHLSDLYNLSYNSVLFSLAFYLLVVLLVVVKLATSFSGGMKSFSSHEN